MTLQQTVQETVQDTPPQVHNSARLRALHDLRILDTAPEGAFDEIAELASEICGAPIAMVSFVLEDRQWYKARVGIEGRETPISQAICVHAIDSRAYLEIEDTLERSAHPRQSALQRAAGRALLCRRAADLG